ncbi:hypothetical protein NDU88_000655, partial [Pleurodeles waltl]
GGSRGNNVNHFSCVLVFLLKLEQRIHRRERRQEYKMYSFVFSSIELHRIENLALTKCIIFRLLVIIFSP